MGVVIWGHWDVAVNEVRDGKWVFKKWLWLFGMWKVVEGEGWVWCMVMRSMLKEWKARRRGGEEEEEADGESDKTSWGVCKLHSN